MSLAEPTFSDATLQAYLNGTLQEETAARLEDALATDHALEARLMALDPLAKAVPEAFAALPSARRLDALEDTLSSVQPESSSGWVRPLMAACVAGLVGLVAGALSVTLLGQPGAPSAGVEPWHQQVAAYQALYVDQTVTNLVPMAEGLEAQFAIAEQAIDLPLPLEALAGLETLELKRAQILGYQGTPLIQIAFQAEDGTPWAFCILANGQADASNLVHLAELEGLASASWASATHGFMVIGGQDLQQVEHLAGQLQAAFSL